MNIKDFYDKPTKEERLQLEQIAIHSCPIVSCGGCFLKGDAYGYCSPILRKFRIEETKNGTRKMAKLILKTYPKSCIQQ